MDDKDTTVGENNVEQEARFTLGIEDTRINKNAGQEFGLAERLKTDKVDSALIEANKFLGEYSKINPQDLSIRIVDGEIGAGTVRNNKDSGLPVIEVQMPQPEQAIAELKLLLGGILGESADQDKKCEEIMMAVTASTALHEGVHGLLDSKPGSKFAQDFERISKLSNERGVDSTLLDEGLAYAIQGLYSPNIEPLGSFAPTSREGEKPEVTIRKRLGGALLPRVKEYMEAGKPIDDDFLLNAGNEIRSIRQLADSGSTTNS